MSNVRMLTAAGVALAAALLHVAPAHAQQSAPPAADRRAPAPGDRRGPPSIDERVQRMTADLALTTDQATRVRAALTAQQRTADSILARRTAQRDAERAAMETMRTNTQKSVSAILTPEQRTRHDAMRARMGDDRRFGRGMRDGGFRGRGPADRARGDRRRGVRGDDRGGPPDDRRRGPADDRTPSGTH
jgi:Spy/CpxP family protein refolding chaperone